MGPGPLESLFLKRIKAQAHFSIGIMIRERSVKLFLPSVAVNKIVFKSKLASGDIRDVSI